MFKNVLYTVELKGTAGRHIFSLGSQIMWPDCHYARRGSDHGRKNTDDEERQPESTSERKRHRNRLGLGGAIRIKMRGKEE